MDLRSNSEMQVVIAQCVRPGDIIRGKVLYRSDAYGFCLSTKEDPFGVVHAESFLGQDQLSYQSGRMGCAGHPMTIVDKSTMSCPITKVQEARKVATRKLVSNDKAWNERA